MLVDDHVAANLTGIEAIIPDFHQTDSLVGDNMEDEYIEGMVASINQPLLNSPIVFINPAAEVIGHQKTEDGRDGQREELLERGTPVHVGREILEEKVYHNCKDQRYPKSGVIAHDMCAVDAHILSEDKTYAKEKAAHHLSIAPLYDIYDLQSFPGFPGTEQEHEYADEVGD